MVLDEKMERALDKLRDFSYLSEISVSIIKSVTDLSVNEILRRKCEAQLLRKLVRRIYRRKRYLNCL